MACVALQWTGGAAALLGAYYLLRFLMGDADLRVLSRSVKRQDGEVVIVTGASSGIGEELAKQLSANGAYVVLMARREAELQRVQKACAHPDKTLTVQLDLTDMQSHADVVARTLKLIKEKWGKDNIDMLVNNGGRSQRSLIEEAFDDLEAERTLLEVNFFGNVSFTKQVLKQSMVPARKGRISFVTSVAGKVAAPVSAGYSASKHAMQGWANTLRTEVMQYGITVCNIAPGPVATPIEQHVVRGSMIDSNFEKANATAGKMTVERACHIMMRALTNDDIYETWISPHPVLLFTYLFIYFPVLAQALSRNPVQKRIDAYKYGKPLYNVSMFDTLFGKKQTDEEKKQQ